MSIIQNGGGILPAEEDFPDEVVTRALVRDVAASQEVAQVLAARGFTQEQVNQRIAQLSPRDLHQLATTQNQLQAAGQTRQEWEWMGIGALAALIIIIALG